MDPMKAFITIDYNNLKRSYFGWSWMRRRRKRRIHSPPSVGDLIWLVNYWVHPKEVGKREQGRLLA